METTSINDIKDTIPYYKKKLRKQKRIEESQINYILQESDGFVSQEPNSDLSEVQKDIEYYNTILNTLRREINEFTASYFVPEFNMTLDELEMYQKDLSNRCDRLSEMAKKSPLTRNILQAKFVTHFYTNYDIDEVKNQPFSRKQLSYVYTYGNDVNDNKMELWNMHTLKDKIIEKEKIEIIEINNSKCAKDILMYMIDNTEMI